MTFTSDSSHSSLKDRESCHPIHFSPQTCNSSFRHWVSTISWTYCLPSSPPAPLSSSTVSSSLSCLLYLWRQVLFLLLLLLLCSISITVRREALCINSPPPPSPLPLPPPFPLSFPVLCSWKPIHW